MDFLVTEVKLPGKRLKTLMFCTTTCSRLMHNTQGHFIYTPPAAAPLQGYVDAADVFQKESNTKPGVDLAAITDRMEIRKAVQSGDIQQAIERVNDLNPEVNPFPTAAPEIAIGLAFAINTSIH